MRLAMCALLVTACGHDQPFEPPFPAFDAAAITRSLDGAWVMHKAQYVTAIEIHAGAATIWDGRQETHEVVRVDGPCQISIGHEYYGYSPGPVPLFGWGEAGWITGTRAYVCTSDGIYTWDRVHGCGLWRPSERGYSTVASPADCGLDGKRFLYGDIPMGGAKTSVVLPVVGDRILGPTLTDEHAEPAKDFAAARAVVDADYAARAYDRAAVDAGVSQDDMQTVGGLYRTMGFNRAIVVGQRVAIAGLYAGPTTGATAPSFDLRHDRDHPMLVLACLAPPPADVAAWTRLAVTGTARMLPSGELAIDGCTVTPAW